MLAALSHMRLAIACLSRSAWLTVQAAWLHYEIHETEAYLRDCARDGLVESLHLKYWRRNVEAMVVDQIVLRGDAQRARDLAALHLRTAIAIAARLVARNGRSAPRPPPEETA